MHAVSTPTAHDLRSLLRRALVVTPTGYLISPALCRFTHPSPAERRAIATRLQTIIDAHEAKEQAA